MVALLVGVFIIGRVSAPSTQIPAQTHLRVPAVSGGGGAACNPGPRSVTAC